MLEEYKMGYDWCDVLHDCLILYQIVKHNRVESAQETSRTIGSEVPPTQTIVER
jgi:hypothetical protein